MAELIGTNDLQRNSMLMRESYRVVELKTGQACRIRDYSQHVSRQRLMRRPCQESRIRATGVGNKSASQRTESAVESRPFGGQAGSNRHANILCSNRSAGCIL